MGLLSLSKRVKTSRISRLEFRLEFSRAEMHNPTTTSVTEIRVQLFACLSPTADRVKEAYVCVTKYNQKTILTFFNKRKKKKNFN